MFLVGLGMTIYGVVEVLGDYFDNPYTSNVSESGFLGRGFGVWEFALLAFGIFSILFLFICSCYDGFMYVL